MEEELMELLKAHYSKERTAVCRGLVTTLAMQIGAMPQVRRMVAQFNNRDLYPTRPMITLVEGKPSIYLLGWREGDFTEIHDHGACEVGVYCIQGTVVEDVYASVPIDNGNRAVLLEMSRFLSAGQIVSCPKTYMHRIGNVFPEVAATLHVYGPVLADMRLYDLIDGKLVYTGCWGCKDENAQH